MARTSRKLTGNRQGTAKSPSLKVAKIAGTYCRKCMRTLSSTNFYSATDTFLDTNGLMSVCKACIDDMYDRYFVAEKQLNRAIYRVCKTMNIYYDTAAIDNLVMALDDYNDKGKLPPSIMGLYLKKMKFGFDSGGKEFTFVETPVFNVNPANDEEFGSMDDLEYFKKNWGEGLSLTDYRYLEERMIQYSTSYRCDTEAEKSLFRQICFFELDIQKKREANDNPGNSVKTWLELLKTAGIDPKNTSAANSGKSLDSFSSFIKQIEETEPAEYYKDKELFKDFDNIGFYFDKYVKRPLKNFITGSRDFNVTYSDDYEEDFDIDGFANAEE